MTPMVSIETRHAGDADVGALERLVVAPVTGRFRPLDDDVRPRPGDTVLAGQVVGLLEVSRGEVPLRSPFSGVVAGVMAADGERLRPEQPVVWLRVPERRR